VADGLLWLNSALVSKHVAVLVLGESDTEQREQRHGLHRLRLCPVCQCCNNNQRSRPLPASLRITMDGPTRASKRRKLDTPPRNAPSPLAKPSTVRKSARAAARTAYKADGSPKEQGAPLASVSRCSLKKANGTARQQHAAEAADVWDDIEGALGESPTKRVPPPLASAKKRATRKTWADDAANENTGADEQPKATPSRRTGKKGAVGDHDDLVEEAATPSRRASKRAAPSTARRTPKDHQPLDYVEPKPGSLRKPHGSARAQRKLEFEDAMVVATPSSRSKRARHPRFPHDDTIPETDDEPEKEGVKRRTRQVDRVSNQSEDVADTGKEQADADAQEDDDDEMSVDGNSVLGSVLDPTEPSPFNKPSSARKEEPDIALLADFIEPGRELDLLKTVVLERISGKRPVPLVGLDDAYKTVHQLIENTVAAGEGNSLLVIGARGSGKTALVNRALSEVSKDNSRDYHVVRLNGFIHTDDKIALREIWRQLGKEMELEEESGGVGKSYADALQTLLALLSHPSEHTGVYTEEVARAVVFVMDEFDLFTQHPRQTLLYNLFDIAQSRKAPIAVLGLTTHIDVANNLEKRVKSRFSHRYVHLSLAKTFTAFQEMCKANLLVKPELLSVEERGLLASAVEKKAGKQAKTSLTENALSQWNSNINVSKPPQPHEPTNKYPPDPVRLEILPHLAPRPPLLPLKVHTNNPDHLPLTHGLPHDFPRRPVPVPQQPPRLKARLDTPPLHPGPVAADRRVQTGHYPRQRHVQLPHGT
jgi:origin recognition complex subunit 4